MLTCPKCRAPLPAPAAGSDALACPACGARFRIRRSPQPPPPPIAPPPEDDGFGEDGFGEGGFGEDGFPDDGTSPFNGEGFGDDAPEFEGGPDGFDDDTEDSAGGLGGGLDGLDDDDDLPLPARTRREAGGDLPPRQPRAAPERERPAPAGDGGERGKSGRRDAQRRAEDRAVTGVKIGGGIVAAAALLGVVWLAWGLVGGGGFGGGWKPDESDGSGAAVLAAYEAPAQPPPPRDQDAADRAEAEAAALLEPAFVPALPPPAAPLVTPDGPLPVASAPPAAEGPPAAPPTEIAADLREPVLPVRDFRPQPLASDNGGAFLLLGEPTFPGNLSALPDRNAPIPAARVVDVATGEEVGRFSEQSPWWTFARLSPGGTWLVGPDPTPPARDPDTGGVVDTPVREVLQVWKAGAEAPSAELKVPGPVGWLGFLDDRRLAVLTWAPAATVQVWDVEAAAVEQSVPLGDAYFPAPERGKSGWSADFYLPVPSAGLVAPGGGRLALVGPNELLWIDLEAGRVARTLPLTPAPASPVSMSDWQGLGFSRDGARLFALTRQGVSYGAPLTYLRTWNLADGRLISAPFLRVQAEHADDEVTSAYGALAEGPVPGSLIAFGGAVPQYNALFPSPSGDIGRGGRFGGAALLDGPSGAFVAELDFAVLAAGAEGRLLAVGPKAAAEADPAAPIDTNRKAPESQPPLVFPASLERGELIEALPEWAAIAGAHGDVPADLSALTVVKPDPPAAHAAPPRAGARAVLDAPATYPYRPVDECDTQVAVITSDPRVVHGLTIWRPTWLPIDRAANKLAAEPVALFAVPRGRTDAQEGEWPAYRAALSPDGGRLAVVDVAAPHRIDLWDRGGKRVYGFAAAAAGMSVEHLDWSGGGDLLVSAGGTLTVWDLSGEAPRAKVAVPGGYSGVFDAATERGWVAVGGAAGQIDLLDAATGACLLRCRTASAVGPVHNVAVSTDGRRLAALISKTADPEPPPTVEPSPGAYENIEFVPPEDSPLAKSRSVVVWDLDSGEAVTLPGREWPVLTWFGPDHLLTQSSLYDVREREWIGPADVAYRRNTRDNPWSMPMDWAARSAAHRDHAWGVSDVDLEGVQALRQTLGAPEQGEMDYFDRYAASSVVVPELTDPASTDPLIAADREILAPEDITVRIDVDLGDEEWSRAAAEKLAPDLAAHGYKIGPDGWTFQVRYAAHDFVNDSDISSYNFEMPVVNVDMRLLDEAGVEVARIRKIGHFAQSGSRYFTGGDSREFRDKFSNMPMVEQTGYFDFPGDPRQAILVEILEDMSASLGVRGAELPRRLCRAGGKYRPLPLGSDE